MPGDCCHVVERKGVVIVGLQPSYPARELTTQHAIGGSQECTVSAVFSDICHEVKSFDATNKLTFDDYRAVGFDRGEKRFLDSHAA